MSAVIRTRIGPTKRHLTNALQEFSVFDIPESLPQTTEDQLVDLLADADALQSRLVKHSQSLNKLVDEWSALIVNFPTEEETMENFISKYGDFRLELSQAREALASLEKFIEELTSEMRDRGMDPSIFDDIKSEDADSNRSTAISPMQVQPPARHLLSQRYTQLSLNTMPQSVAEHAMSHPRPNQQQPPRERNDVGLMDSALYSRLELPEFGGNMILFPEFWARYSALIDCKTQIDGATKFSLLKSCLKGDALQCVEGLPITAQDYNIAIDILKSTYQDTATIRHVLLSRLAALQTCDQEGKKLHTMFLEINKLVRQYHHLDPAAATTEYGLGAILLNKLPLSTRRRIYDRNVSKKNLSPMELVNYLSSIVQKEQIIHEMSNSRSSYRSTEMDTFYAEHNHKKMTNQKPARQAVSSDVSRKNPKRNNSAVCCLCGDASHGPRKCTVYTTANSRREVAKQKKLCFNCLSPNHAMKDCKAGNCRQCQGRHHTSLCHGATSSHSLAKGPRPGNLPTQTSTHCVIDVPNSNDQEDDDNRPFVTSVPVYTVSLKQETQPVFPEEVLLMCADITVFNPANSSKKKTITAFFDNGSSRSYISSEVAKELQLHVLDEEEILLNTFAQKNPTEVMSQLHNIGIHLKSQQEKQMLLQVKSLPVLTNKMNIVKISPGDVSHVLQEGITNRPMERIKPSLLIGSDYFWELLMSPRFFAKILPSGHRLLNTRIGPIVTGKNFKYHDVHTVQEEVRSTQHDVSTQSLELLLEKFWDLETIGIKDSATTNDDDVCLEHFHRTVTFNPEEQRYYVKWPFKSSTDSLPSNYAMCVARLHRNWKTLSQNPDNLIKYHDIILDQLKRNMIEEVPSDEPQALPGTEHFISHHAVVTENKKTTKVRIVYDASGKTTAGQSLNEHLYRGPVLLPDLVGILLRIRTTPILISADIEKAFLMIGLQEEDRNFAKFLWLRDPKIPPSSSNTVIYRFRRVCFGVISSPFLLGATIHHHLMTANTPLSKDILLNLYVDNVFMEAASVDDAKSKYIAIRKLFTEANMNLREWCSNNTQLNEFFSKEEKTTVDTDVSVLGLSWNNVKDTLAIKLNQPDLSKPWTKRMILKQVASTFDPLGLLSPMTLLGKLFLQSLWKHSLSWDQPIPADLLPAWMEYCAACCSAEKIEVSRQLFNKNADATFSLHLFSDASKDAYAAIAYLRILYNNDKKVSVKPLMSKTRLSPIKSTMTIPRLELSGIYIAAILLKFLHKELNLPITADYIWSDSKVALQWCKSSKTLPVFIANRVKAITQNAGSCQLRHVRSEDNPADLASRGILLPELVASSLWWNGPTFLRKPEENWPEDISEKELAEIPCTFFTTEQNQVPEVTILLFDVARFSSFRKLLNTAVAVLEYLKKTIPTVKFLPSRKSLIYEKARQLLFRQAQKEFPPDEFNIRTLNLFICPKTLLWRSKGRLENSHLPYDTKNPVYLPKDSRITLLYILAVHGDLHHCGASQTLNEIRQGVWIPKGRQTVTKVIRKECFSCRRKMAKPYRLPDFPDHPEQRVTIPTTPFCSVGLDYLGPFTQLKEGTEKVWICLITCLNTRASYTDIAVDLSSTSFLHIMRRFVATHGSPSWILSDNAPTFRCFAEAYQSLPEHLIEGEDKTLIDYCYYKEISFKFTSPFSPWSGGIYEKMVHLFKTSFFAAIGRTRLSQEELRTFCKETESCINCRPLTYVSNDPDDRPLRPVDFMRPQANLGAPRFEFNDDNWKPSPWKPLINQWKENSKILDRFWQSWQQGYLTALREKSNYTHPHPRSVKIGKPQTGEIVILHDQYLRRGQWRIGRIVSHPTERSVSVKLPNGNNVIRPLNLVYPLEVCSNEEDDEVQPPSEQLTEEKLTADTNKEISSHPMTTRSRTAARVSKTVNSSVYHLALFISLMGLLTSGSASSPMFTVPGTRCKPGSEAGRIVYYDKCRSSGVTLHFTGDPQQDQHICWKPVNCPLGHIQVSSHGFCSNPCSCPQWTPYCSHYYGQLTNSSSMDALPTTMLNYLPPNVCSFEVSEKCSKKKSLAVFSQIQLYDKTTMLVPDLHITTRDYGHNDDVICFSTKNGTLSERTPNCSGLPNFCRRHRCSSANEDVFCLYTDPVTFYNFNGTEILVEAWGKTLRSYFEHFESVPKHQKPVVTCAKGGVRIHSHPEDSIEFCVKTLCILLQHHKSAELILFPTSVMAYEHDVVITTWQAGIQTSQSTIKCPASPICELIDCTFCLQNLYNRQCWKTLDYILTGTIVLLSLLIMYICCCRTTVAAISAVIWCLRRMFQCVSRLFSHSDVAVNLRDRYRQRRRRRNGQRSTRLLTGVTIFAITIGFGQACSEIASFTATTHTCLSDGEKETCTFTDSTMVNLQPVGQEICLAFRSPNSSVIGSLSLRVTGIRHVCHKRTLYFTRNHRFEDESSHRCSSSGSCQDDACEKTTHNSKIVELSSTANRSPGFTHCVSSCGCITCGGCFFCSPSCLFWRLFAVPTNPTIIEVFKCPSFDLEVLATVTLKANNVQESTNLTLIPGRLMSWNDIKITLLTATVPAVPLLSSTFASDGTRIGIVEESPPGQLRPNSIGQLQCSDRPSAELFNCQFSPTSCHCSTTAFSVTCTCPSGDMTAYIKKNPLPASGPGIILRPTESTVEALISSGSSTQVLLSTSNVTIVARKEMNACNMEVSVLEGCHSCSMGANFEATCFSTLGEETAELQCGEAHLLALCSPKGIKQTLKIHLDSAAISLNCLLSCPGSRQDVLLQGQLDFISEVPEASFVEAFNSQAQPLNTKKNDTLSFNSILNSISSTLWGLLPITHIVVALVTLLAMVALFIYFYFLRATYLPLGVSLSAKSHDQ